MPQFRLFTFALAICMAASSHAVADESLHELKAAIKSELKAEIKSELKAEKKAQQKAKRTPKTEAGNKLVGTWKPVSAEYGGKPSSLPETSTTLKHITPTHYSWFTHDADGMMTRGASGTYTLEGDEFTQMGECGLAATVARVKGKNTYKCKVEGNKWYHTGSLADGLAIEEVWQRVEK
jgi:hypothetical protein